MTNSTTSTVVIELRTPMQNDQSCQSVDETNTANDLESANDNQNEEMAVDGGYGWICVICVFLINAHTWGFNSVGKPRINQSLGILTRIFIGIRSVSGILP